MLAQVGGTEAMRELSDQDEAMQESVRVRIGKRQAGGAWAPGGHRAIDGSESIFAEDAIVAEALELDQWAVGRKADLAQLWKVMQAPADSEVVGIVDGGFSAQGSIFLVILLDARVLVIDVQGRGHIVGHHPGAEARPRIARYPAIEDELNFLGSAEVEVLADHLFEEQAAVHGAVEHLGDRELRLQD